MTAKTIKLNFRQSLLGAACLPFTLITCSCALLHAQDSVPKLLNYQGKLTDNAGATLANGTYRLRFSLFSKKDSAQAGDTLIWGQEYSVAVTSGIFSVVLGAPGGTAVVATPPAAVNDLGFAFTDAERYLQMTVLTTNTGTLLPTPQVLSPRQQMLSTPYALNGNPTGVVMPWIGSGAPAAPVPAGWLPADGRTIGKFGSGAAYANEAARPLFRLIWNSAPSQLLTHPDNSTAVRGASADSDFDAGKRLKTPDLRSRVIVGAGRGAILDERQQPLTDRLLGSVFGSEKHQLTELEMPSHKHDVHDNGHIHKFPSPSGIRVASGNGLNARGDATAEVSTTIGYADIRETEKGGNVAHNIVQPGFALTYLIRL